MKNGLFKFLDQCLFPNFFLCIKKMVIKNELVVLNYHGVSGYTIHEHIRFLSNYYKFIGVADFKSVFENEDRSLGRKILLTFDDGYKSFYFEVFPILKRMQVPALVFLPTDLVNTKKLIWTDYLKLAIENKEMLIYLTQKLNIKNDNSIQKSKMYKKISDIIKQMDNDKKEKIVADVANRGFMESGSYAYEILNWKQIREMAEQLIDFGSHSHTHPILSKIPESELNVELQTSKDIIEKRINKPVEYFAYPNGKKANYNRIVINKLIEFGYKFAFTTVQGRVGSDTSPYEIKRVLLFDKDSRTKIALKLMFKVWKK